MRPFSSLICTIIHFKDIQRDNVFATSMYHDNVFKFTIIIHVLELSNNIFLKLQFGLKRIRCFYFYPTKCTFMDMQ